MKIFTCKLLLLFFLVLTAKLNADYVPLTQSELFELIPSEKRIVTGLTGNWERSVDGSNWENIRLPYSETSNGQIIYRRNIQIPANIIGNNTFHLYFLGVDNQVEVYFNEQLVGRYLGALTPFMVRIPDRMVSSGNNLLKLIVTPAQGTIKRILNNQIFGSQIYTGLIREVLFIAAPSIWINDINYSMRFDDNYKNAEIKTSIKISSGQYENLLSQATRTNEIEEENLSSEFSLGLYLINKHTKDTVGSIRNIPLKIEPERTIIENLTLNLSNPNLWSVNYPNLYELKAVIRKGDELLDDYFLNIGLRDFKVKQFNGQPKVFINNQVFDFKGVIYIEDYIDVNKSITTQQMREDIKLLKMLGANVVRFKYGLPHPYFMNLCDMNGIMVMVELPMYNIPCSLIALDEVQVYMENLLRQIVLTYGKYTSVLSIGTSEGTSETNQKSREILQSLSKIIKEFSNKPAYKTVLIGSEQIDTRGYDIIGFTSYNGKKDYNVFRNEILKMKSKAENVPFFVSYGTFLQPGNANGYSDPLSIENQAHRILNYYRITEEAGGGSIVLSFNDYRLNLPTMLTNHKDLFVMTTGLFDRNRNSRLSYTTLQALFNNEREPLLNAGSFTFGTPISFIIIGIVLLIILVLIINRFRRFREYLFRAMLRPYNFYADIRDQRIMPNFQTMILGLIIGLSIGMYVASMFYHFRMNELVQYLYMLKMPNEFLLEFFFMLIWKPELAMFLVFFISLLLLLFVSIIIRIFAIFLRARIYFSDSAMMSVWSGIPMLIFLPISIILNRTLVLNESLALYFIIIFVLFVLWTFLRLLKSISVVFDKRQSAVYLIGFLILLFVIGIPILFYHINYSYIAYISYLFENLFIM